MVYISSMIISDFNTLDPKKYILIKGARLHNLKNIDVAIPRNKLVVITGLSGSGKSTLAFDTLYAEGQRRYVESLSSYARQFLGRINKPEVDYIKGISPAIAIEQKVNSRNPRSTVGTTTEIYDYLKLLFSRIGKTYSPISNQIVKRNTVSDVVNFIEKLKITSKVFLLCPLPTKENLSLEKTLELLVQQGFSRIKANNEIKRIDDFLTDKKSLKNLKLTEVEILIDRFVVNEDKEELLSRAADSTQTAFYEGNGICFVDYVENEKAEKRVEFSNKFELDGMTFTEPSSHFFSFNNPVGACKHCDGFGSVIGIDKDLVIPDKSVSVYDGAIACWKGDVMGEWKNEFIKSAHHFDFPVHRPYYDLTKKEQDLVWTGNKHFSGLNDFFKHLEEQSYKIQYRVMLSRYRGKTVCPDCNGTRLRKDANYVKIKEYSISDIVLLPIEESLEVFKTLKLDKHDTEVAKRLLLEITNRLQFLLDVGLGYLTLNRLSNTLSGGESQRINLATSLGSSLVGSMYVLDEPSIGLHPKDTERLITVLKALRDVGNTVIVVEHDEEIMRAADQIIDIGPLAGSRGGELVFQGNWSEIEKDKKSITAQYLNGNEKIPVPTQIRTPRYFINLEGVNENNLQKQNVSFPLNSLCVVTGVSGSGKTTLVKRVLYPALKKIYGGYGEITGSFDKLTGDYDKISAVEMIDQNPIGKSSRSNPVTYVKAYDEIRNLFTEQPLAKTRGYKTAHFSFNVDGGRCEVCDGEGEVTIEMQFMADIHLECDVCHGKRFKAETLEVVYREKSIWDVLCMTVDDAIDFFSEPQRPTTLEKKIVQKLMPLSNVGLGYIQLGQSSSTLSGGEAQRIKLASFLTKGQSTEKILFIFDEPTTGLHFHDIQKLLYAFTALIENGHSLLVIEHNLEVIKCADYIIDLGPEGGSKGGKILFSGTPKDLLKCKESFTAKYLAEKL
ncbi:MAG: excinuclease ABC subunit UvrA [Bacteroidota bacterium]